MWLQESTIWRVHNIVVTRLRMIRVDMFSDFLIVNFIGWCRLAAVVNCWCNTIFCASLLGINKFCDHSIGLHPQGSHNHNFAHAHLLSTLGQGVGQRVFPLWNCCMTNMSPSFNHANMNMAIEPDSTLTKSTLPKPFVYSFSCSFVQLVFTLQTTTTTWLQ